jgi:hypothetical protein
MKKVLWAGVLCAATSLIVLADNTEDLKAAAKKLADQPNYSWATTIEVPGSQFTPGPRLGKANKDGFIMVSTEMQNETSEAVMKGEKGVVKTDSGWKAETELEAPGGNNRGAMFQRMLLSTKAPTIEVADLATKVKELKKDEDVLSGDLTEEGAKQLMTMGRRNRPNAPAPKDAKGSVKIWIKDGMVQKYILKVEGKVTFGQDQQERAIERITTTEIKDVGTTKMDIPDEAKKKVAD